MYLVFLMCSIAVISYHVYAIHATCGGTKFSIMTQSYNIRTVGPILHPGLLLVME